MSEGDSKKNTTERATKEEILKKSLDPLSAIKPPVRPNRGDQEEVNEPSATSDSTEDEGKK